MRYIGLYRRNDFIEIQNWSFRRKNNSKCKYFLCNQTYLETWLAHTKIQMENGAVELQKRFYRFIVTPDYGKT